MWQTNSHESLGMSIKNSGQIKKQVQIQNQKQPKEAANSLSWPAIA